MGAYGFNEDKSKHSFEMSTTVITPQISEKFDSVLKRMFQAIRNLENNGSTVLYVDIVSSSISEFLVSGRYNITKSVPLGNDDEIRISKAEIFTRPGYAQSGDYNISSFIYYKSGSTEEVSGSTYVIKRPASSGTAPTATEKDLTLSTYNQAIIKIGWIKA